MTETVLIVDTDTAQLRMAEHIVQHTLHYRAIALDSADAALRWIHSGRQPQPDAILLDIAPSDQSAAQFIHNVHARRPQLPVIALTPYGDRTSPARVMQAGASDFLTKPVGVERLQLSLQHALKMQRMSQYIGWLERKAAGHMDLSDLVGQSPAFRKSLMLASEAAASKKPAWIVGETGTGKEMFARAIHGSSDRAGKPFVVVNCRMVPEHLAESILFGQEGGASAGHLHFTLGKLREADQGTLLLEEIGALPPALQRRLAEVLSKGAVTPMGGKSEGEFDLRLLCTASVPLDGTGMPAGVDAKFWQCLQGFTIVVPPLRERKEDILLLAEHFVTMYAASENKYVRGLNDRARNWLSGYVWPGNVHQLANTLWRAVVMCGGELLDLADVQAPVQRVKPGSAANLQASADGAGPTLLDERGRIKTLKSVQEEAIRFALQHAGGCMTRAAQTLGIGRSTLYRKVSRLDLEPYISRANQTTRPMMNVSSVERS